jgi:hypothetical protein
MIAAFNTQLHARLAVSGFKSKAWHLAVASTHERRHTAEPSADSGVPTVPRNQYFKSRKERI